MNSGYEVLRNGAGRRRFALFHSAAAAAVVAALFAGAVLLSRDRAPAAEAVSDVSGSNLAAAPAAPVEREDAEFEVRSDGF